MRMHAHADKMTKISVLWLLLAPTPCMATGELNGLLLASDDAQVWMGPNKECGLWLVPGPPPHLKSNCEISFPAESPSPSPPPPSPSPPPPSAPPSCDQIRSSTMTDCLITHGCSYEGGDYCQSCENIFASSRDFCLYHLCGHAEGPTCVTCESISPLTKYNCEAVGCGLGTCVPVSYGSGECVVDGVVDGNPMHNLFSVVDNVHKLVPIHCGPKTEGTNWKPCEANWSCSP